MLVKEHWWRSAVSRHRVRSVWVDGVDGNVEPIAGGRSEANFIHVSSVRGKEEKVGCPKEENQLMMALLDGALQRRSK
jgi:hypothetical protein